MSDGRDDMRSTLDQPKRPSSLTDLVEASANFQSESGESQVCIEDKLIGTVSLNDRLVKAYLDEILVILISARDGACGQDLIQDLYRLGCGLSPGTIYPHLHELADDGVLDMHEQRRTKQFEVADHNEVTELVRSALEDLESFSSVLLFCDSVNDTEERHEEV